MFLSSFDTHHVRQLLDLYMDVKSACASHLRLETRAFISFDALCFPSKDPLSTNDERTVEVH